MKRTEFEKEIEHLIGDLVVNGYSFEAVAQAVARKIDNLGFLPPTNTCKLIPDPIRGGMKHSPAERKYDEE